MYIMDVPQQLTYILDDMIQVKDVIGEALVLPAGARIFVGECLSVVGDRRVLNYVIQLPELSEHVCPEHVPVPIFRRHNDSAEASCIAQWIVRVNCYYYHIFVGRQSP